MTRGPVVREPCLSKRPPFCFPASRPQDGANLNGLQREKVSGSDHHESYGKGENNSSTIF